jgi:hypothetical protein
MRSSPAAQVGVEAQMPVETLGGLGEQFRRGV